MVTRAGGMADASGGTQEGAMHGWVGAGGQGACQWVGVREQPDIQPAGRVAALKSAALYFGARQAGQRAG